MRKSAGAGLLSSIKFWAVLLIVLAGLLGYRKLTAPSDEALIRESLRESISASREGIPGGVLEYLSERIRVNELEYSSYRRELSDAIRRMKPNLDVLQQNPVITGDTATITSAVTLSLSLPKVSMTIPEVTITFQRESAREWIVLPAARWRVIGVDVSPEGLQSLASPFGW